MSSFSNNDRIVSVEIDEAAPPPLDIERERRVAIFDLIEESRFKVAGVDGPYALTVARRSTPRAGYVMTVRAEAAPSEPPLCELIADDPAVFEAASEYLALCSAYRDAVRRLSPTQIESADAARRGLHTESSQLLRQALGDAVLMDQETARRLFSVCCALESGMEKLV